MLISLLPSCPRSRQLTGHLQALSPHHPVLTQAVLPAEWRADLSVSSLQTAVQHDVPVPGHGPLHGQHDLWLGQEGGCSHFSYCPPVDGRSAPHCTLPLPPLQGVWYIGRSVLAEGCPCVPMTISGSRCFKSLSLLIY